MNGLENRPLQGGQQPVLTPQVPPLRLLKGDKGDKGEAGEGVNNFSADPRAYYILAKN